MGLGDSPWVDKTKTGHSAGRKKTKKKERQGDLLGGPLGPRVIFSRTAAQPKTKPKGKRERESRVFSSPLAPPNKTFLSCSNCLGDLFLLIDAFRLPFSLCFFFVPQKERSFKL